MKYKIIKSSNVKELDLGHIKVTRLFNEEEIDNMSLSIVKVSGTNKKCMNKKCNSFYYVLKGSGIFNIDGTDHPVEAGDVVYIQNNTVYYDSGDLTLLAFASPKFSPEQVEYFE